MKKMYALLVTAGMAGYWIPLAAQYAPSVGEIVITEVMANPEAVSDANGEWIELFNPTARELQLNGLILKDDGSNRHLISGQPPLIIRPGAFMILAKNSDSLTNGGVHVDYQYTGFTLGNTEDQVILCLPDETVIDRISYGPGWPLISGSSMELQADRPTTYANDDPSNWHEAIEVFGAGDKGSPGRMNTSLTAGVSPVSSAAMSLFPNPSTGQVRLEIGFPVPASGSIYLINLMGQKIGIRSFENQVSVRETVDISGLCRGFWLVLVQTSREMLVGKLLLE